MNPITRWWRQRTYNALVADMMHAYRSGRLTRRQLSDVYQTLHAASTMLAVEMPGLRTATPELDAFLWTLSEAATAEVERERKAAV